jgi:acyl dehydratase
MTMHGAGHCLSTASGKDVTTMNEPSVSAWPHGAPTVGDTASMSRTVDGVDIAHFTEISGDRNPLHYDQELAASTRFGGIVVQGGVTTAILNAVVAERLPERRWDPPDMPRPGRRARGGTAGPRRRRQ